MLHAALLVERGDRLGAQILAARRAHGDDRHAAIGLRDHRAHHVAALVDLDYQRVGFQPLSGEALRGLLSFVSTQELTHDAERVDAGTVLQEAARQIEFARGKLINIDATIMAQEPRIMSHAPKMKRHIADALCFDEHKIGIKATTNEHLGFVGREEGIAAMAVASVELPQ